MASRIARIRVINRRTSHSRTIDPAQQGAYYARLKEGNSFTITGLQGRTVFRQKGVLAAKWEPQADETMLLVLREEAEDDPIVVHAFRPREGGNWETDDAHAVAIISPDERHIAIEHSLPNPSIAVLSAGKVARDYIVKTNLGAASESVVWSEDSSTFTVITAVQSLCWSTGKTTFSKI
jgi:hypothetical protein